MPRTAELFRIRCLLRKSIFVVIWFALAFVHTEFFVQEWGSARVGMLFRAIKYLALHS